MSKARKRIFPKPPVRFHSKLAKELGKYSNKTVAEANLAAIYLQKSKPLESKATGLQAEQLKKLRATLARRKANE